MNRIFLNLFIISILFSFIAKPAFAIKIGLYDSIKSNHIAMSREGHIINANNNKILFVLKPMKKYQLRKYKNSIAININDKYYDLNTNKIILETSIKGFISTKNKWYRGKLIVLNNQKGLTFINDLNLEAYLMGVVPSEMPSSWNHEAHKAQAIAARSYAIANLGKRANHGYDLKDTPHDQAYGGATAETKRTTAAVLNTKGMVLTYKSKVIPAYYHSSSGGYTKNARKVWSKDLPYIKSVQGYDKNVPKRGHGIGMSQHGANNLAKYGYNAYQILCHYFNNVKISKMNTNL